MISHNWQGTCGGGVVVVEGGEMSFVRRTTHASESELASESSPSPSSSSESSSSSSAT